MRFSAKYGLSGLGKDILPKLTYYTGLKKHKRAKKKNIKPDDKMLSKAKMHH